MPDPDYELIEGDLLDSDAQYIAHQCNCVTSRPAHLAAAVFARFPWADIYSPRAALQSNELPLESEVPGSIVIRGDGVDQRFVIAIIGQYYPSVPMFPQGRRDGIAARRGHFHQALLRILEIPDLESVAFPWCIGCGAAGGDWEGWYEPVLRGFARAARKLGVETRIHRLPE